jgi:hypothetical protein
MAQHARMDTGELKLIQNYKANINLKTFFCNKSSTIGMAWTYYKNE